MKLSIRLWPALIFVGSVLAFSHVHAEPFRIGVVDPDRIFREANSVKVMQARLQQEFAAREKVLMAQGAAMQGLAAALDRAARSARGQARFCRSL